MENSTKAWIWGLAPIVVLVANIAIYAIVSFLGSMLAETNPNSVFLVIIRLISMLQSFLGVICLLMVPVGIIMAIVVGTSTPPPQAQPPV